MTIRRMQEGDIAGIYAIERQSFALPWSEDSIRHDLTENVVARWLVMADEQNRVVAYAAAWLVMDEAQICSIAVDPAYRGRGHGKQILQALIALSKEEGMRMVTLEVRRSNTTAQNLYHSVGFLDVGYRKHYYEDNREDALIMYLEF